MLRPIVAGFSKAGLPMELIGAGWEQLGLQAEATSIANQQLPARYRRALAVLNDHHQAMADYGYLNNRVFDVLACGVPVITDAAPGCPPELEPAVIRHTRRQRCPRQPGAGPGLAGPAPAAAADRPNRAPAAQF